LKELRRVLQWAELLAAMPLPPPGLEGGVSDSEPTPPPPSAREEDEDEEERGRGRVVRVVDGSAQGCGQRRTLGGDLRHRVGRVWVEALSH